MPGKVLSLIIIIFFAGRSHAGIWTSYTNTDGVRQIIVKGADVWGATSGGVIAYDVSTGDVLKLTNTEGLGGINVNCAEMDTAGDLWFGTDDGWLSRIISDGSVRNFSFRDSIGLFGRAVALFDLETERDRLWVGSDLGVSKFLPFRGEIKETARQLGNIPREEDVTAVKVIGDNLWAGTARGVAFIDKDNPVIENYANWHSFMQGQRGLGTADIRSITSYYDTVLVGTDSGGVYKFLLSPDTLWESIGLAGMTVYKLANQGSSILAATNDGLYQYTSGVWSNYPSSGLPQGRASDLAVDINGSLWAATPSSGLGVLIDTLWTMHTIPGPASNIIGKTTIDTQGGLWIAQDPFGLSRLSEGSWFKYNTSNTDPDGPGPLGGLLDNSVVSVSVAPDGKVWASSYGGGLYMYDWISWHHWDYNNSPMYGVRQGHWFWAATAVKVDPSGNVWVTAFDSDSLLLIGTFDPDSPDSIWQTFKASEIGLTTNFAQAFEFQGDITWVGRGDGFDRLNHAGTPFDRSDDAWEINMNRENTADMQVDQGGTLWLATATGLYYVPPSADTAYSFEVPPSIAGSANAVELDGAGNLWVGTVAGLGILKSNRSQPSLSIWEEVFTTANSPLLNDEVNSLAINVAAGIIYIGTDGGLSVFDSGILPPSSDLSNMEAFPNPVVISEGDDQVEFTRVPSSGILTIFTAAGDMVAEIDLSRNNTWDLRNSGGERVAGGIYIFHVRSGDASGTGKFAVIK